MSQRNGGGGGGGSGGSSSGSGMPKLSDDELARIFERLDVDDKGWISFETLVDFAKQSGLQDPNQLEVLDYNNTGRITFSSFAKGVRTLFGEVPETPRLGRKAVAKNKRAPAVVTVDASEDESEGDDEQLESGALNGPGGKSQSHSDQGEDEELERFNASNRNGERKRATNVSLLHVEEGAEQRRRVETPHTYGSSDSDDSGDDHHPELSSPVSGDSGWKSHHTSQSSPKHGSFGSSFHETHIADLEAKIRELHNELEEEKLEQEDKQHELEDLKLKCKRLEQRCAEYEAQLDGVEEQLEHSKVEDLEASCAALRRENEDLSKTLQRREAEMEEAMSALTVERDRLKEDNDVLRHSMREEQQVTKQLRLNIIQMQNTISALEEERDQALSDAKTAASTVLEASLTEQARKYERELHDLQTELEAARTAHSSDLRELKGQRAALEQELQQLHQDYKKLEKQHQELDRRMIQQGMELAAVPVRDEESLMAEMNNSSRDTLLKTISEQEDLIRRLQQYMDSILPHVVERMPEVLEKK